MSNLFPNVIRRLVPLHGQQIRYLPRWSHRNPVRVIPSEEYEKTQDIQTKRPTGTSVNNANKQKQININWEQSRTASLKNENSKTFDKPMQSKNKFKKVYSSHPPTPLSISKSTKPSKQAVDMLETIIDKDGNFVYTKMKNNDSRIASILVEVKSKKEKSKKDLILLEGKRLIKEALEAGCQLEYILFSRINEVEYLKSSLPKLGAKLYKMPYREMQMWSDLTTTPGIMGIFKVPDTESITTPTDNIPLTVICDNVREPSNLGAVLRTCSGVGCANVILTKGCVNVWDTKVLRSAAGAHFKLHISKKLTWDDIKTKLPADSCVYIADNKTISSASNESSDIEDLEEIVKSIPLLPYYGVNFGMVRHIVLIIGGETEGISAESYKFTSEMKGARLIVPLSNNVDSLNTGTALGVIAFEIKRQLLKGREMESNYMSSKC